MSICYIVATPIGNLDDITPRALSTLKNVEIVFAEDTRVSKRLFNHFGITTRLLSLHEHNEIQRLSLICDYLEQDKKVAIISDAGTPLISDPGYPIVVALRQRGFEVIPIPGASAVIAALSISGIPTDSFIFEGFLPAKRGQRQEKLQALRYEVRTLIFYESSHRIIEMLKDACAIFSDERIAFIGREMTKHFEDYRYGSLASLLQYYQENSDKIRGEFVVVIHGAEHDLQEQASISSEELLTSLLIEGISVKQASAITAKILNESKNDLYQQALSIKDSL